MRITSRGQVTIAAELREALGLLPGTEVDIVRVDDHLELRRAAGVGAGPASSPACGGAPGRARAATTSWR